MLLNPQIASIDPKRLLIYSAEHFQANNWIQAKDYTSFLTTVGLLKCL